jgi:hypothetical protein
MSVNATKNALQALHRAVSGVTSAPDAYPASLETADLPCVLTYIGPGVTRWDSHGGDMKRRERQCIIRWYVAPAALGVGVDEGMQQAIDLLDTAIALYEDTDTLSNGAQIHLSESDAQAIRDSGVLPNLSYGEAVCRGFEVTISVWEWVS